MQELKRQIKAGNFFNELQPNISTEDLEAAKMSEKEARDELSGLFKKLAENTKKRETAQRKNYFDGCGDAGRVCIPVLCDCGGVCRCRGEVA